MRDARQRGFTLLEVIAAIVLLGVAFGALLRTSAASMNLAVHAIEYTQSAMWAKSMLDKAFVTDFPAEGVSQGKFDDRYRWRLEVTPWPAQVEADPVRLYRVNLEVMWTDGSHAYSNRFETLRLMPVAIKPPVEQGGG